MRLIDADALIKQLSNYELQESPWGFYGNLKTYEAIKGCIDAIKEAPTVDAVEVVRCRDCKWYEPRNILHADGTRTYVDEDSAPVTADVGINCAGRCIHHTGLKIYCVNHDRENPEDEQNIVIFRSPDDFCSYGERKR